MQNLRFCGHERTTKGALRERGSLLIALAHAGLWDEGLGQLDVLGHAVLGVGGGR